MFVRPAVGEHALELSARGGMEDEGLEFGVLDDAVADEVVAHAAVGLAGEDDLGAVGARHAADGIDARRAGASLAGEAHLDDELGAGLHVAREGV